MRTMFSAAVCGVMAVSMAIGGAALEREPSGLSPAERTLEQFVEMVNGRWVLTGRSEPGGTHNSRISGWLQIDLVRQTSRLMGPRALGRITSEERHVLPREAGAADGEDAFLLEAAGLWEVTVDAKAAGRTDRNETRFIVAQALSVKANAGGCREGLLSQTDIRLRLTRAAQAASVRLTPGASNAARTFRGRPVPKEWSRPVTFRQAAVAPREFTGCDRELVDFAVADGEMRITWSNGDRDTLKHTVNR